MLSFAGSALACTQVYSVASPGTVGTYQYDAATDEWNLVSTVYDPDSFDYVPRPGDSFQDYPAHGVFVLYKKNYTGGSPPPGDPNPPVDPYGLPGPVDADSLNGAGDDGIQCGVGGGGGVILPPMTVTGSVIFASWRLPFSTAVAMIFSRSGGSGAPIRVCNTVISAYHWAEFSADLVNNTFLAAQLDVTYFRQIGMHYPYPQTSLIAWQKLEVNWSLYGADNQYLSEQQVVKNFITAIQGGEPSCH